MQRATVFAGTAWLVASCGLGVTGSSPSSDVDGGGGSGSDAGTLTDAGSSSTSEGGLITPPDAPPPAPAKECTTASTTCSAALGSGWTPILFSSTAAQGCPANFTATVMASGPTAAANACACACTITTQPTCSEGSVTGQVGSSSCNGQGTTYSVSGTGCSPMPPAGSLSAVGRLPPLPLIAGRCDARVERNEAAVTSTSVLLCAPPPECVEDTCLGSAPTGLAACIVHDGDLACPTDFGKRTVAGTTSLACGGCAGCTNTATCSTATMRWYSDTNCGTERASRIVDGNCNALQGTSINATRYRYDVTVNNAQCSAGSPAVATVTLVGSKTICCR